MSVDTFPYKKDGGKLYIEVTRGYAHPGSYIISLWEANDNKKAIDDIKGNFINDKDDKHELELTNQNNDGRLIECSCMLDVLPPENNYSLTIKINQNGNKEFKEFTRAGSTSNPTATVIIFILLKET
ncbi:MAG: hypothetical protein EPN82_06000 [Bacteroidetes bacterium]|nr:MAG: hypothetical protein EPN82_06000 [Bacteroidota bacterium]